MADFKRLPASDEDEALLRDRQIDALLEDGLDRYFAGRYEDAIHLWTRVLFLDRSHARARAYIDRARTALAEMHRRSDELLHTTRNLLEQGQTDAARKLLSEAVATTGDDVQAAALRVQLERLEQFRVAPTTWSPRRASVESGPAWQKPRRAWPAIAIGVGLVSAATVAGILFLSSTEFTEPSDRGRNVVPARLTQRTLTSGEVALVRARTAAGRGRLSDALRELDRVGIDSPDRPAADQFRNEILQLLMASVRSSSATTSTELIRR